MFCPLDIQAFSCDIAFQDFSVDVRGTMANTLPKVLSKSSTRYDLIECIEKCIKTSLLRATVTEESLIMDAMTEYILVCYFDYMHPVCLA